MSTLLIPSSFFATCRLSLGRSRLAALAEAMAAAFAALLLGTDSVDAGCGHVDVLQARSLRPGSV